MITLPELLEDPFYRKYFTTHPRTPDLLRSTPLWKVHLQQEMGGRWFTTETETYLGAFKIVKKYLRQNWYDGAIQCKGIAFPQPTRWVKITKDGKPVMVRLVDGTLVQKTKEVFWVPKIPGDEEHHRWCTYCRRPTVFKIFRQHRAFRGLGYAPRPIERCVICGSSLTLVRGFNG